MVEFEFKFPYCIYILMTRHRPDRQLEQWRPLFKTQSSTAYRFAGAVPDTVARRKAEEPSSRWPRDRRYRQTTRPSGR